MAEGKIKKIIQGNGFGFIEGADGKDVFFHVSSVADNGFDDLAQGQHVRYELDANSGKGPRAKSVTPLPFASG